MVGLVHSTEGNCMDTSDSNSELVCQNCGACCAYADTWPQFRFDESDMLGVPPELIDESELRMKCIGDRCVALEGTLLQSVSCKIYQCRPEVCMEFQPGSEACHAVRSWVKSLKS